jgi:2-polyprenyl-6-hydroxyphenyl methylase/3-demethylubiquinone-9 3-methyltransferase
VKGVTDGVIAFDYYSKKLSAERLQMAYKIASPRVKQYLNAEIDFALERMKPGAKVLELGCGYGRILERLKTKTGLAYGIDTSLDSLLLARQTPSGTFYLLAVMNAVQTAFKDGSFDVTACLQNGISAFNVDQKDLMTEAVRITRPGGTILFSSYAAMFWPDRLEWFRHQADHGLLGEIDEEATGAGVIVCKDGFKATTIGPEEFEGLAVELGLNAQITIVDESSVFCEIIAP